MSNMSTRWDPLLWNNFVPTSIGSKILDWGDQGKGVWWWWGVGNWWWSCLLLCPPPNAASPPSSLHCNAQCTAMHSNAQDHTVGPGLFLMDHSALPDCTLPFYRAVQCRSQMVSGSGVGWRGLCNFLQWAKQQCSSSGEIVAQKIALALHCFTLSCNATDAFRCSVK